MTPNSSYYQKMAKHVYKKFISKDSKQQVNLPHSIVTEIEKKIEDGDIGPSLYDKAAADTLKHLRQDAFPRFRNSAKFSQLNQQILREEVTDTFKSVSKRLSKAVSGHGAGGTGAEGSLGLISE